MIIGVNGKIGSGKDTVGKIAQCLMNHPKISNKDLLWMIENNVVAEHTKCEIKKFAGKLKQIASLLTGVPVEKFEDQEFKKQEMPEEWWYKNVYDAGWDKKWTKETINYPTHTSTESHIVKTTYRQFLQNLGTEAMRDGLHTNVWVNALFADYKTNAEWFDEIRGNYKEYPNWIITDMRFPNEMEAVKERDGITIRVVRYPKTVEVSRGPENVETIPFDPTNHKHMSLWKGDSSRLHPSETALDGAEFDYEIINDGTIEDLIEKVREILINEKLL